MKFLNIALAAFLCLLSHVSFADDIAFGEIKGIKVYDFPSSKVTKIYFADGASKLIEDCDGVAIITHALHEGSTRQVMTSIALAAYMAGKKVRAYSHSAGSCEIDLIAVQDSYF